MNGLVEWLANLEPWKVIIVIAVLVVVRFALLALKTQSGKSAAEIAESLAIAMGLVFLIIRPFFVQAFFIPSESMVPTLLIHDHILVNKTVYLHRDPKPGEVVVFAAPPAALTGEMSEARGQTDFIKRCAGVPGDEIYVVPSYLEVNGKQLDHMALRTIFEEFKSEKHVGVYYRFTPLTLPGQDVGQANDQLKRLLAAGEGSHRDVSSQLNIGNIPVRAEDGAPMVRLADNSVYVDGRKLTDSEIREYMPAGAKIKVHPGYIVRNGKRWDQPYLAEDADSAYPVTMEQAGNDPMAESMADALDKAVSDHKIQEFTKDGHLQVKLMPGEFLMMGDNRNNSSDGRYWGPLDRWRVKGRAMFIFWPVPRIGWVR